MAVFITVRVKGESARLCAAYDQIADYEESTVAELGCHVCAKTDDGILVSGTWKSREAFERLMASEEFQKILHAAELPRPDIAVFEVYRSRH
jgi:quinol monooxygenase YgiN